MASAGIMLKEICLVQMFSVVDLHLNWCYSLVEVDGEVGHSSFKGSIMPYSQAS